MNKMNKKGFTLIEMLVVIAIIAVLVSIIIPVVGGSTTKAKAAANAANLRSAQAEYIISELQEGEGNGKVNSAPTFHTFTSTNIPSDLSSAFKAGEGFKAGKVCTFQGLNATQWASIAGETANADTTIPTT